MDLFSLQFLPTLILRHKKENLKKCSLRGLEGRLDFSFYTYPKQFLPPLNANYIMLTMDAPELSLEDAKYGLFILDGTWRHAKTMQQQVANHTQWVLRSLPHHFRTAYPRRQEDCAFPDRGLASIEAIYLSYLILGRKTDGLLDGYYWKEAFLNINSIS